MRPQGANDGLGPRARQGTEDDYEAAAEALALAFTHDPAWTHVIPDDASRAERLLAFFSVEIGSLFLGTASSGWSKAVPGRRSGPGRASGGFPFTERCEWHPRWRRSLGAVLAWR
ncbi:MAG: hypothetical protein ACOYD4_01460 [Solirubrobacterales bacterium]